jgi:hypothetical protein
VRLKEKVYNYVVSQHILVSVSATNGFVSCETNIPDEVITSMRAMATRNTWILLSVVVGECW